jgi:glycerophosphoryl diester phosphodiesterase
MRPLIVAHRGASDDAPEHTHFAYAEAVTQGADSIEVDLRLTADGALVCLHDETLTRVAGDPRRVDDVTLDELRTLDVGTWFNTAHPDRARPEFAESRPLPLVEHLAWLRETASDVGVHAEMKEPSRHDGRMEEAVVAALHDHIGAGADPDRIVVETFEVDALRRVRELAPELAVGLLWVEVTPQNVAAEFDLAVGVSGPSIWSLFAAPDHVERCRERGIEVHVWTADDEEEVEALTEIGVDAIVTNRPGFVRQITDQVG